MPIAKFHLAEPQQLNPTLTMTFCGNLVTDDGLAWAVDAVTCARCYRHSADFKISVSTRLEDAYRTVQRAMDSLRWAEQTLVNAQESLERRQQELHAAQAAVPGWTPELHSQVLAS